MRRLTAIVVLLVVLAVVAAVALWQAARHVPDFYSQALNADAAGQREASDRMLQKAAALASDLKRAGHWQAVFTADEINGWLAVDLVENYGGSLPPGVEAPRVVISPGQIMLGCRYRRALVDSVLWMAVEPYLVRPGVVAIRIRKVRAGWLPVPLQEVLDAIDQAVRQSDLRIEWRQADADPVAEISLPPQMAGEGFTLDKFQVFEGKIVAGGRKGK